MTFMKTAGASFRFPLSLLCAAVLLSACSVLPEAEKKPAEPAPKIIKLNSETPEAYVEPNKELDPQGRTLFEQRGSGKFVGAQGSPKSASTAADGVNVNFENAPLGDVLAAILGDMLKVPYSLEGNVGGNVTLVSSKPVPQSALLDMLESMLEAQGIAMVQSENGIYRIGPAAQLRRDVPVNQRAASTQRGYSVQIIPLQYLSVDEAVKILEPLGMKDSVLRADPVRNILMLGASGPQMQNATRTLQMFDVDVLKGMSYGIYEVTNLDAKVIVDRFNAMIGNPELGPLANVAKLVAMEEINSVMVITPNANQLDSVRTWLKRLDSVGLDDKDQANSQLYVYNVQNGEAKVMAELLGQIFGGTSTGANPSTSGSVAPGLSQTETSSDGTSSMDASSSTMGSSSLSGNTSQKTKGAASVTTPDGTRIVADEGNNSLLVMAAPKEWRSIRSALDKLDKTPAQVLVEVSIWEVTLTDALQYGVEWYFDTHPGASDAVGGAVNGGGRLSLNNAVGRLGTGFSYVFTGSDWRSVINMLSTQSRVKSLSSPSVLVLDNREAKIQVGTQQPISTGTTSYPTSGNATTTQNFTLKDTGVLLKVKPRINAGGLVVMDINQEVTDVGEKDVITNQSTFLKRSIESSVAIKGGDTIILGGLIQDNQSKNKAGIPYLSQLPLIGPLFGYKDDSDKRTELLVTISPRAINQYQDFEKVGEEFREKMRGVTESFREELNGRP
ncbi:type II secretion system secretin GspD [Pseudomonas sp. RIT-PI-AD]|uniref:type II secretion system secretin GspD n=1 Tax=Pseudomonas sp. RIT-PI-AD TaxID=3035294 RepID=UPI0021D84016|nr:type II secretion system secretin GspD [Pseudomonas sp. RIT-PI-AD]